MWAFPIFFSSDSSSLIFETNHVDKSGGTCLQASMLWILYTFNSGSLHLKLLGHLQYEKNKNCSQSGVNWVMGPRRDRRMWLWTQKPRAELRPTPLPFIPKSGDKFIAQVCQIGPCQHYNLLGWGGATLLHPWASACCLNWPSMLANVL